MNKRKNDLENLNNLIDDTMNELANLEGSQICNELDEFFKDIKKKMKEEDIFDFNDDQICKRYDLNEVE